MATPRSGAQAAVEAVATPVLVVTLPLFFLFVLIAFWDFLLNDVRYT